MEYVDTERFKNHASMKDDLQDYGVDVPLNISEAALVHLYDITFLVGRYDLVVESRCYMPKGTRVRTVR